MIDFWGITKDVLLPPRCLCCSEYIEKVGLCNNCWREINWISDPKCEICGQPLENESCRYCTANKNYFDRAVSVMIYERLARQLIINFKDHDATLYAPVFAQWMNRIIQEFADEVDFLVSVPISKNCRLTRKYNQTELLCLELQKLSKLHFEPRILEKAKETVAQKTLNRERRLKNLRKSFTLNPEFPVKSKNILLIDDVITTGATSNACAQLLKEAGANKVYIATLARVILKATPSVKPNRKKLD